MISIRRLVLALALCAPSLGAQVIGHLPTESPFTDATGRHLFSLTLGHLSSVNDPAGVGPTGGLSLAAGYEYDFPSPFLLMAQFGILPTSEREVLDPLFTGDLRRLGREREPLFFADFGIAASLTGEKAWHGVAPRTYLSVGYIAATDPDFDIAGYRFGGKFSISYGLNLRGVRRGPWEWRADLGRRYLRMDYPTSFTDGGSPIDESIIGNRRQNPWTGQTQLSVGIARVWGR